MSAASRAGTSINGRVVLQMVGVVAATLFVGAALGGCTLNFATSDTARRAPLTVSAPGGPASVLVALGEVPDLASVVAATIRSAETVAVLSPDAQLLAGGISPAPATLDVPARPSPQPTQTGFQRAEAARALDAWRASIVKAQAAVDREQTSRLDRFVGGLGLADLPASTPEVPLGQAINVALRAETSLESLGERGGHRVILVGTDRLGTNGLDAGELDGDTVIVDDPALPGPGEITAVVNDLYGAGAAWALVVDPVTADDLDRLVALALSADVLTESFAGQVLFANDSAQLSTGADSVLARLVAQLTEPPQAVVIDAFASSPGSPSANLALSAARGHAVAAYLEQHGINPTIIDVIARGATDFVAPGPSPENRRVTVIIRDVNPANPSR